MTKKQCTKSKLVFLLLICLAVFVVLLPLPQKKAQYSSVVYADKGELLFARTNWVTQQWQFSPIEKVSQKYKTAVILAEDKRFYGHFGFDPLAIARAFWVNFKAGSFKQGGSSITQQTIRLLRGNPKRTVLEKIYELCLAVKIDLLWSKEKILHTYMNEAPMGGNIIGIHAASYMYFNNKTSQLSWAQAALFAVLPNAPGLIHTQKNRHVLKLKRNKLLLKIKNKGYMSQAEYDLACLENIPKRKKNIPQYEKHLHAQSGSVQTHIDYDLQKKTLKLLSQYHKTYRNFGINNHAIFVVDLASTQMKVYIANSYNSEANDHWVDMYRAYRSPGSTLKPFLYYAMIEQGTLLPYNVVPDVPVEYQGFRPKNSQRQFLGYVSAQNALARSLNVPAVILLYQYGYYNFYQHMKEQWQFDFKDWSAEHMGLSSVLGGAPVQAKQLLHAYVTMARLSRDNQQNFNIQVEKNKNNMSEDKINKKGLNYESAWLTRRMLQRVNVPKKFHAWQKQHKIAWKTGTSYGHKDAWSVGFNDRYAVLVWIGNANSEGNPQLAGAKLAAPVFFDVFSQLPKQERTIDSPKLSKQAVCQDSGFIAGRHCRVSSLQYVAKGKRYKACPYCQSYWLNSKQEQVYRHCSNDVQNKHTLFLPPKRWQAYSIKKNNYKSIPKLSLNCAKALKKNTTRSSAIKWIHPEAKTLLLPKDLNEQRQPLLLKVFHTQENEHLYWSVNNQSFKSSLGKGHAHEISIEPKAGLLNISIMSKQGDLVHKKLCVQFEERDVCN